MYLSSTMKGKAVLLACGLRKIIEKKYFVPIVFILAMVARLLVAILLNGAPVSDAGWYVQSALNIASGQGYTVNGIPTAYFPLGYPAFLAIIFKLFGPSLMAVKLFQIVLSGAALFLFYLLSRSVFKSEVIARCSFFILSFHPNHIFYSSLMFCEIFYLFLLLVSVVLFYRKRWSIGWGFITGVVFGVGVLTKTQSIFLPLLLGSILGLNNFRREKISKVIKYMAVLYLAIGMVLVPWLVRNMKVFGKFGVLATNGGINLYIGNNPLANGGYQHFPFIIDLLAGPGSEIEKNRIAKNKAIEYISQKPLQILFLIPKKLKILYATDVDGITWHMLGLMDNSGRDVDNREEIKKAWSDYKALKYMQYVAEAYYLLVIVIFVFSFFSDFKRGFKSYFSEQKVGLWIILYLTAIHILFYGSARYHFAIFPWMVFYAASFIGSLLIKSGDIRFSEAHLSESRQKRVVSC